MAARELRDEGDDRLVEPLAVLIGGDDRLALLDQCLVAFDRAALGVGLGTRIQWRA